MCSVSQSLTPICEDAGLVGGIGRAKVPYQCTQVTGIRAKGWAVLFAEAEHLIERHTCEIERDHI